MKYPRAVLQSTEKKEYTIKSRFKNGSITIRYSVTVFIFFKKLNCYEITNFEVTTYEK